MNDLLLLAAGIGILFVIGAWIGDAIERRILNGEEREAARRRNPRP